MAAVSVAKPSGGTASITALPVANSAAASEAARLFAGAMPKSEIGALEFLEKYPECDGRGVVVAIFDTGCDPGAKGLQTTPDGKPKFLDIIDCTGSGDIDTSTKVDAVDGCVTGTGGVKLRLNPDWVNPEGTWRVGSIRLFELYAGSLTRRMKAQRKKGWAEAQRRALAAATKALADFAAAHAGTWSVAEEKEKEELEARLKLLQDAEGAEDPGPLLHVVAWHDGNVWRAALDTSDMYEPESGKGMLADAAAMTNYRLEQQYGTFSAEDACNYAINIYDDGDVVSVVVDAGAHGTHVAGITAAYHPDEPQLNGIAPGAQLISCKIGDTRLGSMETNVGLTRALVSVLEHKADAINMSYGEASSTPNRGRFMALADEIVNKHGVIFVSSAGNAGPALSTVGAPGGTSSSILGIGAYVSPQLAAAGHSIRSELAHGQQYTWSSRGPAPDGDIGVTFSAPGGAIAPVPQWTQQARQLMNGTSMASPAACGGVALLLSGLKALRLPNSPTRVRRAIENTCSPVAVDQADGVLTYGRGLLQVHKAFEYLQQSHDGPDVHYEVAVARKGSAGSGRGVYVREAADGAGWPAAYTVTVTPKVHEDADTKTERLAVEDMLALECSAPWVTAPALLLLPFGGRSFEIQVDASSLPAGLHYAEVAAVDLAARWRGPLFRVPVTFVKPMPARDAPADAAPLVAAPGNGAPLPAPQAVGGDAFAGGGGSGGSRSEAAVRLGWLHFQPGTELRRFVAVPEGASWAELSLRAGGHADPIGFMVRAAQLLPSTRYSDTEKRSYTQLGAHEAAHFALPVAPGGALEVTVGQFWSSLGAGVLQAEVAFHGLEVHPSAVALEGAGGPAKLQLRAPLRPERVKPVAKLTHVRLPLRPASAELAPMTGPRDTLPDGRMTHRLVLTYKLEMSEEGDVTPRLPSLNNYVYDGELEAQMTMVFDANKKRLAVNDIYPSPVSLKKGSYTVRALLRHDSVALLTKLKALPLVVERKLKAPVAVPVYGSATDAVKGENAITKERVLCAGERAALFVGPVNEGDLPPDAGAGQLLVGSMSLASLAAAGGGDGAAPTSVPLTFSCPPKAEAGDDKDKKAKEAKAKDGEEESPAERLDKAMRDARVGLLRQLSLDKEQEAALYRKLQAELLAEHPKHLPLLLERLQRLAKAEGDKRSPPDIVKAADAVIAVIDTIALACFLASKTPVEGPAAAAHKKEMEEAKKALVEALEKKCWALLEVSPPPTAATAATSTDDAASGSEANKGGSEGGSGDGVAVAGGATFEAAYAELRKWVDTPSEREYAALHSEAEARAKRPAMAIKALEKVATNGVEDKSASEKRAALYGQLGWLHMQRREFARIVDSFPERWPLF